VLVLSERVVITMLAHRQLKCLSREAGGILLGRRITESLDVVVDNLTRPSRRDLRSRFRFVRDVELAQRVVVEVWAHSKGTQIYLGEWHTHPEDVPRPSPMDQDNWINITAGTVVEFSELFFVIVGRRSTRVWEMNRNGKLRELSLLV
jgi:integrative and conjugative element protein (TIGR02256 family)